MNAISPVTITNLRAATPYKLFVTVNDSQTDPFEITELFNTAESSKYNSRYSLIAQIYILYSLLLVRRPGGCELFLH